MLTGTGGQGLILASIILAEAAVNDGKNVVQTQSYGPEARGGASMAGVIIDIDNIDYPLVTRPDVLLAMSKASYRKYLPAVPAGGLVIVDSTFVDGPYSSDHRVIHIPITDLAREKLGRGLVANIVALGVVNGAAGLVKKQVLAASVLERVPKGSEQLNLRALELGETLYV
ncbi:MAG: 2-oxoacid:ferredoxin oxidoreductase subunit gamma [Firmicutes bacterium]|nr:2-oxoacid:ferredoxin oxidoreductase subunit gamma [Bacillota bacterium]